MLLCVAGGGSSGFNRDRSREGARCSAQSTFVKNQQIMVEERCSMTRAAVHVSPELVATQDSVCLDPRASRSVHNKYNESSLTYRGKVIVVRGEDSVSDAAGNGETCATTTTFKSNIVNGKRSTNTILVRYKPSKAVSQPSDDNQSESGGRNDSFQTPHTSVSSSSSTVSSESSTSSKKDTISTSAWAQIMELEGYRSPAIGLDNVPNRNNENTCDTECTDISTDYSKENQSSCSAKLKFPESSYRYPSSYSDKWTENCAVKDSAQHNRDLNRGISEYNLSFPGVSHVPNASSEENYRLINKSNWCGSQAEIYDKPESNYGNYTSVSSNCSDKISEDSLTLHCSLPSEKNYIRVAQKVKSPMYRSESSRVPKTAPLEKNKSRRKTLPDGNLQLTNDNSKISKCAHKKQCDDIDPNASWGQYNARAMRESVRKVAQKYAETVHLRRQTHSQLDALPEVKGVQLTRFVSPYSNQDHTHSSTNIHCFQNDLYGTLVSSAPSHLHEVAFDTESNRRKVHLLAPTSTHHNHNMSSNGYVMNCSHKRQESKSAGNIENEARLDHNYCTSYSEKSYSGNESISSNSDKCSSKDSQVNFSSGESNVMNCDESESSLCSAYKLNSNYLMCDSCSKNSAKCSSSYQASKCPKVTKNENTSLKTSNEQNTYFSVHIRDIKSKLCPECAQAAESGPPSKHSASRSKCHKSHNSVLSYPNICSSFSQPKRPSTPINDSSLYSHSHPLKKDDSVCKSDSSKRCTRLTAREMANLVHGSNSEKLTVNKIPHSGVTSKVTSWIQKQKDKRKPVFFIGDAPTFFSGSYKEGDLSERSLNSKSKRSLSLSSVRENEVSSNSRGFAESTLNLSAVRLNPSTSDDRDHDHKHLYVKRATSSCSIRGSTRRKMRQGSPVREEKESVAKNFNDQRNQVDGCIASWNKPQNNTVKNTLCLDNPTYSELKDATFEQHIAKSEPKSQELHISLGSEALPDKKQNINSYNASDINLKTENREQKFREKEESAHKESSKHSLGDSCRNLESFNESKNERSSFSKRLLNIKQLTRALSLHTLKKKRETLNESQLNKGKGDELVAPSTVSKWTRSSKRKLDNSKYGSLRKSLSYCELAVREATVSGKSKSQQNAFTQNAFTEIKTTPKSSARTSVSLTNSVCCCSATLRRSVSLYWKFPLNRCLEYSVDEQKSDFLARLCFSRLHRRNGVPPFLRQVKNKKIVDKMKDSDGSKTVYDKQLNSLDIPKHEHPDRIPVIILKLDERVIITGNVSKFEEKNLNGNEEKSWNPHIIMGLDSNHALNDTSKCSRVKMVEEYVPFNNSTKTMENHLPLAENKSKASSGLRLRSKVTSRSERHAKGKSTSELCGRTIRKTVSDALDSKRRPTSQFYDLDELDSKSDSSSGPNLLQMSSASSGSQPILAAPEQISDTSEGSSALTTRHLSLHTSIPQLTPADSLLQRFRKSFAQRFQKKKPDPVSSAPNVEMLSTTVETPELCVSNSSDHINISNEVPESKSQINSRSKSPSNTTDHNKTPKKCDENKASPHSNSKQVHLQVSDGRKKTRRRTDWRLSLIYDSVDSIFDSTTKSSLNKCHGKPNFTGSDANILRKRAASTSDYSPKSKAIQRPVSVADYLTLDNSPCTKVPDGQNDLTRTASDTTSSEEQQKNLTSLDQIWRANPVKLCRVHSRLLMCRHKGRYRLRRSISQPVELEMTGSVHNLRDSTHGSADHENFQKGSLSSDDEASSESDIYHSYCCSPTRRSNTCWELSGDGTMYAEALWDHETIDPEELPFQAGDIIEVTDTSDHDWWWGTKDGHGGWFPSAFVRLYVSHRTPSLHFNGQQADRIQIPYSPCKVSMNNLSCEQVRANIVQEIVATERDYVKHLKDVVEGYLKQVHRRPDMFSKERIETVFGNIKEIYTFQSQFLKQLEECLDKDAPHLSQIGNCFLNHKEEFKMYSQYCNNHPLAVSELQELYCDSQYIHFFEACRLLQEMIDISLDGFLLTPIQRICKYPLQLAELLKFTEANHLDHIPVTNALAAMKEVAELVNERKRRMECLERIAEWQNTIEGWEGPDVLDTSSILIHCGEVTRVSSSWSRDIYLFIFDHQLIYCKKDLLKRHTYAYKGRLNLDHCDIVDVEDGKDSQFAVNVKNAWKIYCKDKDKWYLFYAKTSPEKDQWLRAFKAERQRVIDDEKQAFVVTEEAKKSARLAVHNKQKPKRPRAKFTKGRRCHPDVAVTELLLDSPSAKARSGSLPSNIHPELAIMAGAKLGPTRKKGSGWFHFGSGKKPKS